MRAPARWQARRARGLGRASRMGALNLGERLGYGQRLYPGGDRLVSRGGGYQMWLPPDGNLAIDDLANGFGAPGNQQWRASDDGLQPFSNPAYAELASDGELAVYDTRGNKRWSNGLHNAPGELDPAGLLLQTDGNAVVYDARGVAGGGARWASQFGLSHSLIPQWLQDAASYAQAAGTALGIPLANFNTAILTGQSPIAALKADVAIMQNDKALAEAVTSGDYEKAWSIATQGGKVFDSLLPSPAGRAYANGIVVPPSVQPTMHVVALHVGAGEAAASHPASGAGGALLAGGAAAAGTALWWFGSHGWKWVAPRWMKRRSRRHA